MKTREATRPCGCHLDDKGHSQAPTCLDGTALLLPLIRFAFLSTFVAGLPSKAWNSKTISIINPQVQVGTLNKEWLIKNENEKEKDMMSVTKY